jgi:hypothetical protein
MGSACLREDLVRDGLRVVCTCEPDWESGERAVYERLVASPVADRNAVPAVLDFSDCADGHAAVAKLLIESIAPREERSSGAPVPAACVEERNGVGMDAEPAAQQRDPTLGGDRNRSLTTRNRIPQERT